MNEIAHRPLRLAIAGLGQVGRRHAAAMAGVPGVGLAAVVDPDSAARAWAADRGLEWFETLDGLFRGDTADGVILATPTTLHVRQGLECIASSCPVLVEKPIAVDTGAAAELVDAAEAAGVPLLVGHHRRHNPLIRKAHEIVASGQIGDVRAIHSQCWFYKPDHYFAEAPWRTQKGAGPISVNLVHDVDLMRYLCGEVISVQAQAAPSLRGFENEDVAAALLRFASGAIGTLSVSDSISAPWSWELTSRENPVYPATTQSCYTIGGSRGSLSIPDLRIWQHGETQDWWSPLHATHELCDFADPLVNQIEHFARVIRGQEPPLVSGAEGLRSLAVVEAVATAAQTGATIEL